MTYLVTGTIPATSNAERAQEEFQAFDNQEKAVACAESWLKDGRVLVHVWTLHSVPTLKTVIDWKNI